MVELPNILPSTPLSFSEVSYSRTLTTRLGKKRAEAGSPRSRFLSPALPLPFFSFIGVY